MLEDSSVQVESPQAPVDMESDDICWICLDGTKDRDPLINPCRCPRKVHPRCLARWQLQQAGRLEETNCRFCQCNLADWKTSLTPENLKPDVQRVQPIMVVYFEGQIHRIPVKQGPDGLKEFTLRIRELFRLPDDVDISLTFGCKEPLSGQHLKLEGIGAFDAAVHCASVAAAERQHKLKSNGGSSDAGGPVSSGGATTAPALPTSGGGFLPPGSESDNAVDTPGHASSRQRLHHHYHHNQLERSASALDGMVASPSAPVSAQTSGGGAEGAQGSLHPAASAPVLSHYASDSNLLAAAHPSALGSPRIAQEISFPGCSSLSDEPASAAHSARTSSGGGAVGLAASTSPRRAAAAAEVRQLQQQGASASATSAFPHSGLTPRAADVSTSPFQAAAMAGRYARRSAGSADELLSPQRQQQQLLLQPLHPRQEQQPLLQPLHPRQEQQPLVNQHTAPAGSGPAVVSEVPLAGTISEPGACLLPLSGPQTPPGTSFSHLQPCQQQQYQPSSVEAEFAYSSFPYSMPVGSQYAAPLLPPLAPNGSGGDQQGPGDEHQQYQPHQQAPQAAAARPISPSPAPAAVPLTPRDHYDATRSAAAAHVQPSPGQATNSTDYLQHHPSHTAAPQRFQAPVLTQQQQELAACVDLSAATTTAAATTPPSSSGCSTPEGGPATPNHPVVRRTVVTPTTLPRLPTTLPVLSSPPLSPTATSSRHHPYHAAAEAEELVPQLQAAVASSTGGGLSCDESSCGAAANRPVRRTSLSSPRSKYDMSLPSPADDSAALGSLTGRLKFSLRAFSRKVARSLNFQRGISAGAGASISAHSVGRLSSVTETEAAEAEEQAEIAAAAGRADCAAAMVPSVRQH